MHRKTKSKKGRSRENRKERGSEFVGTGIEEREREISGKIERVKEIERQEINLEEGDKIGIQEVERKQRRGKTGEIER